MIYEQLIREHIDNISEKTGLNKNNSFALFCIQYGFKNHTVPDDEIDNCFTHGGGIKEHKMDGVEIDEYHKEIRISQAKYSTTNSTSKYERDYNSFKKKS